MSVFGQDRSTPATAEETVAAGETRLISAQRTPGSAPAHWLTIRNGALEQTASECDVLTVVDGIVPAVELTDAEIALALRNPFGRRAVHGESGPRI